MKAYGKVGEEEEGGGATLAPRRTRRLSDRMKRAFIRNQCFSERVGSLPIALTLVIQKCLH